jgi:diaminopimelate decarboxylase
MKPMGDIPAGFGAIDGELSIAGTRASELIGDVPTFVYDAGLLAARMARLRAAMPAGLAIHYAMKANPFAPLVATMARLADGIDVASAGELRLARAAGAGEISFAGPGKRDAELADALAAGFTINVESEGEFARIVALAERGGVRPRLAVRVNPDFDVKASGMRMGGGPAQFGVDAERVPALVARILASGGEFRGFHIFAGSQNLRADLLIEAQANTLALAARLAEQSDVMPPLVNLGGGFGIPYFPGEAEVDVAAIGAALGDRLADLPAALADSRFAIELGRWLVGPAGVYLARVVDVKDSRGRTFVVTEGGLHHQLAATGNFGTVIRRNYPLANASRVDAAATMEADVVGCLCTPLDRLGEAVMIAPTAVGDIVAVFMAGAYGATASPAAFLGHPAALERLVGDGD